MPSIRRRLASLSSTTRILAFKISADLTMAFDSLGLACEFQGNVQRIYELIHLDRLCEISEESCSQTLFDVPRHRICAESNHGYVRSGRVFAKDFQSVDTADAGQIDIHQDHVRPV